MKVLRLGSGPLLAGIWQRCEGTGPGAQVEVQLDEPGQVFIGRPFQPGSRLSAVDSLRRSGAWEAEADNQFCLIGAIGCECPLSQLVVSP